MLVAWALFSALFFWRLDPVERPLVADNQLYFYMAERAAAGVPPHISHVDSKNELGVLLTAGAIRAGRMVGMDDVLSSRLISIAFAVAAVVLIAELGTLLTASAAVGHLSALALLAARGIAEHSAAGNNVKIFLLTFALLAHYAMARAPGAMAAAPGAPGRVRLRNDLLAGLAAGAAFACWQPALLIVAAVVGEALLARGGSWRRAIIVGLVAALPMVAYELYFFAHGALAEQFHQAYVMTLGSVHKPRRLLTSLAFLLHEAGGAALGPRVLPASFALVTAGGLLALLWAPIRSVSALRQGGGWLSCLLAAAGTTAFTIYDHQGVPDLFFPDPYFALATGILALMLARGLGRILPPRAATLAFVAMGTLLALQIRSDEIRRPTSEYQLSDQRQTAEALRIYKQQYGDVWVYGAVHLLGLAHLDNHVPYGLFYDDVKTVLSIDTYLPLRDGRMPEVIAYNRGLVPGGQRYLLPDYVEITPPAFAAQSVAVWRRVAAQPGGLEIGDWRDLGRAPSTAQPATTSTRGPRWAQPKAPGSSRRGAAKK